MNDRFKFRIWDKKTKEMFNDIFSFCGDKNDVASVNEILSQNALDNNNILMQSTGLRDKNGTLIYEGDILGGIYENLYIHWCDKCMQFQIKAFDYGCMACEGDVHWAEIVEDNNKLEIIGNIYENKELLESEEE